MTTDFDHHEEVLLLPSDGSREEYFGENTSLQGHICVFADLVSLGGE